MLLAFNADGAHVFSARFIGTLESAGAHLTRLQYAIVPYLNGGPVVSEFLPF